MLARTWGTWPDILIDFGRELYVPSRLAQGERLYSDIAFFNGPLSQYLNAGLFRVFGSSFRVIVLFNLIVLAGLLALVYRILVWVGDRLCAFVGCMAVVLLFAFGQYVMAGNYNYVCPYSHETVHGLVLGLVALSIVWRGRNGRLAAAVLTGLSLGLVFLTKAEMFVAAVVAVLLGITLTLWTDNRGSRRALIFLSLFLCSLPAAPVVAWTLMGTAMPLRVATQGILAPFRSALDPSLAGLSFYQSGMGIDDVPGNLLLLLRWTAGYALVLIPGAGLSLLCRRPGRYRSAVTAGAFVSVGALLWLLRPRIDWFEIARPWPLLLLVALISLLVVFIRAQNDLDRRHGLIPRVSLAVFALALLFKMLLHVRIYHYGFALAMPACLVVLVILFKWIPEVLVRFGGAGSVFQGVVLAPVLVATVVHMNAQQEFLRTKTVPVKDPNGGTLMADPRGTYVNGILEHLRPWRGSGRTMVVLPEGVMLNYLSGLPNPTSYINFMPPEIALFGEKNILADFRVHPPDFILLVSKDTSEYGYRYFGTDYGRSLFAWVTQSYRPVSQIGPPPLQSNHFGMLLLEQNASRPGR